MCLHTQDCYKKLYDAGMKGDVMKAPHYYDYYHQKFWIVDNTTVHLSTGMCVCVSVCFCMFAHVCLCCDML